MEELTRMLSGSGGIYGVEGSRLLPNTVATLRISLWFFATDGDHGADRAMGPTVTLQMSESSAPRRRPLYSLHCEIAELHATTATQRADRWERKLEKKFENHLKCC
jgi:hypothetical protein